MAEEDNSETGFDPIENLTPRDQRVLSLAREEADRFHHSFVGSEHLLLGLITLGQGTAITVLKRMGLVLDTIRAELENQIPTSPDAPGIRSMPYTPRVKNILSIAAAEARHLNHSCVGTEHILLGLLIDDDNVAARVLKCLDVDVEETRLQIRKELDDHCGFLIDVGQPRDTADKPDERHSPRDAIDTRKRYDIYCHEGSGSPVVHRNALFKSRRTLLGGGLRDPGVAFLELQLANGRTVYMSTNAVIKFCEPDVETDGEVFPPV